MLVENINQIKGDKEYIKLRSIAKQIMDVKERKIWAPELFGGEVGDTVVYYKTGVRRTIIRAETLESGHTMYHFSDGGSVSTDSSSVYYVEKQKKNEQGN